MPHGGDAADDPAIWVNRRRPARSTVIGTDKLGGIGVYDLSGSELQYRADGKINNVDLRDGVRLGGRRTAIVAATNRSTQSVDVYRVDRAEGTLRLLEAGIAEPDLAVNGICMYSLRGSPRTMGFFVTGLRGEVERWSLRRRRGALAARRVGAFEFGGSAEACTVDDRTGRAYFGEERAGIWRVSVARAGRPPRPVATVSEDGPLVADVEGLAIARRGRGSRLVASSQGSDSFAVYRTGSGAYLRSFVVAAGATDGVEDTDGLEVTTSALGRRFPDGLLVVQDGSNDSGNQNFKLVPLCPGFGLGC